MSKKREELENNKLKNQVEHHSNPGISKIEKHISKDIKENFSEKEKNGKRNNFDDENGKYEYSDLLYNNEVIGGNLILKDNGEELGTTTFSVKDNSIYIDSLISFKKGSGTQLIKKLVEISESLGKGGHVEATASFYRDGSTKKESYRKQLTNLGFYYKLGFRAKNIQADKLIQEYIEKGEEIPLNLNRATDVYLSDEGIQKLKKTTQSQKNQEYFNGKPHKFNVTENQARGNSKMMDDLIKDLNEENKSKKFTELKNIINEQYKQATGEELNLTDEQILSIIESHKQDGELGKLTLGQLKQKVKTLRETITDRKIRRFLLEAGFCGFRYNIGEEVNILRSDGSISKAKITKYDIKTGIYRVEWYDIESGGYAYKDIMGDFINEAEKIDTKYKIGEEVYIPRSDGSTSKAKIIKYYINSGIYRVARYDKRGGRLRKDLTEDILNLKNKREIKEDSEIEDSEIEDFGIENKKISKSELDKLQKLSKGKNENEYLKVFGYPKNVVSLGEFKKFYVSDCLIRNERQYIIGYVIKNKELKLRLFYRSKSEGARRSCPGERTYGGFSKGENIPNSSYETTTRVPHELAQKFDSLPKDHEELKKKGFNPINLDSVAPNLLEREMMSIIKIDKLFRDPRNKTVDYMKNYHSTQVKEMYKRLGSNIDIKGMEIIEGRGYTYEHQYLGTIEVQICRLNVNGKEYNLSFANVQDDPTQRVWIEEVNYANAKISSFGIYSQQINASPLTGKPIDYAEQVPIDMQRNQRIGRNYVDIRDLYQGNPIIKKYKELLKKYKSAA